MVFQKLAALISGDNNKKMLKAAKALIPKINEYFDKFASELNSKEDFVKHFNYLKEQHLKEGKTLDELLPETFGLVKAASKFLLDSEYDLMGTTNVWNMVHFDVQLIGGITIHNGNIAEMRTGEGKTLVCTLPCILNSLTERPVMVVTVNDYLAERDATWMSHLYNFFDLKVGVNKSGLEISEKKEVYNSDIIYGTNNEFGFDYLRDNMAASQDQIVQDDLYFAIIDETDSILIDEARTPLIISAPKNESLDVYTLYSKIPPQLKENVHYNVDEKQRSVTLSEDGIDFVEKFLGLKDLYAENGFKIVHHVEQALKAEVLFKKDRDYMVVEGEVMIVDEFTGRLMKGRRYSSGLHQAIEAKESVEVKQESSTLASITFQNYFRLFDKLAGMSGTAETEEEEFFKIYGLNVCVVPTHRPIARIDRNDLLFANQKGKLLSIAKRVKELNSNGQPVLIGTVSVEKSEVLSKVLTLHGIKHEVLNAKHHQREAEIVANAGQKGSVTIATNMAGRGTDIKLGEGVKDLGGLFIIGTERHESRRIDNQLRGRSGRQGDVGASEFYISMDDDLMRVNGGQKVQSLMAALKFPEEEPIKNSFLTSSIEKAQKRVEGRNFDIRKHVVEYDDIMNFHRTIIYKKRKSILTSDSFSMEFVELIKEYVEYLVDSHKLDVKFDYKEIYETLIVLTSNEHNNLQIENLSSKVNREALVNFIEDYLISYFLKVQESSSDDFDVDAYIKRVYLGTLDLLWMGHIDNMTALRQNVSLQAYGQRDPLIVYKNQSYVDFQNLLNSIKNSVVINFFRSVNL
ncbi:preprotein translocase subunit SecA [bacterium]|nr:preprotein translocase subunit SecA [bacterium]